MHEPSHGLVRWKTHGLVSKLAYRFSDRRGRTHLCIAGDPDDTRRGGPVRITQSGAHLVLDQHTTRTGAGSAISSYSTRCTTEPIVAARITLASQKVAGWNEIDAIAAPCP